MFSWWIHDYFNSLNFKTDLFKHLSYRFNVSAQILYYSFNHKNTSLKDFNKIHFKIFLK